jgi:hypothetical protein
MRKSRRRNTKAQTPRAWRTSRKSARSPTPGALHSVANLRASQLLGNPHAENCNASVAQGQACERTVCEADDEPNDPSCADDGHDREAADSASHDQNLAERANSPKPAQTGLTSRFCHGHANDPTNDL